MGSISFFRGRLFYALFSSIMKHTLSLFCKMDIDFNVFDEEDLATINITIKCFSNFTAQEISNYSHKEDAYKKTQNMEYISFEYADTLNK